MRLTGILAGVTLLVALAALATAGRSLPRPKQPRATRGFKNTEMMTARGFGKRGLDLQLPEYRQALTPESSGRSTPVFHNSEFSVMRDYGKRSLEMQQPGGQAEHFLELLGGPEQLVERLPESIPVDWFVDEMLNNPDMARTMVHKFMDTNQDGVLSPEELLRDTY